MLKFVYLCLCYLLKTSLAYNHHHYDSSPSSRQVFYDSDYNDNFREYDQLVLYRPVYNPSKFMTPSRQFVGQLIPPGEPWPQDQQDDAPTTQRTTKTPLEYVPNRPTFAGDSGGTQLTQLIPSGQQWPSNQEDYGSFSPVSRPNVEDRFKETTTRRVVTRPTRTRPTTKGPLYIPPKPTNEGQRPTNFEDDFQQLNPGLLPSLPIRPPAQRPPFAGGGQQRPTTTRRPDIVDRFPDTTPGTTGGAAPSLPILPPPQRPSFAGSGTGQTGQLVPSNQFPFNQVPTTTQRPNLEDRFQESNPGGFVPARPIRPVSQRPSYAGTYTMGVIIPSGTPWPAGDELERTTLRNQLPVTNNIDSDLEEPNQSNVMLTNKDNVPNVPVTEEDCEEDEESVDVEDVVDRNFDTSRNKDQGNVEGVIAGAGGEEDEECEEDEEDINSFNQGTRDQTEEKNRPTISNNISVNKDEASKQPSNLSNGLAVNRLNISDAEGEGCEEDEELVDVEDTVPVRNENFVNENKSTIGDSSAEDEGCEADEEEVDDNSISRRSTEGTMLFTSPLQGFFS